MKLYKVKELFETNLTPKELEKTNKDGTTRGDVLVRKLKENEPLNINDDDKVIVNGSEIIPNITKYNHYDPQSGEKFFKKSRNVYNKVLLGDDGVSYTLKNVKKTTDFGSSGGTSLGSEKTREVETIQCLLLSYKQYNDNKILDEHDFNKILKLNKFDFDFYLNDVSSPVKINKEIFNKYLPKWGTTLIKTSNALFEGQNIIINYRQKLNYLLDKNIQYRFYLSSSNNGICEAVNFAFNQSKKSFDDRRINISKWNPSDIWAVNRNSESKIISELYQCDSLIVLNNTIDKYFNTRELVGISLKKVAKDEDIKFIINKVTPIPRYDFKSIRLSEDPFSNTGLVIFAKRLSNNYFEESIESMTVRSYSSDIVNISGEMDGKMARHGKVSLTRINKILAKHNISIVPTIKELKLLNWTDDEFEEQIRILNNNISSIYKNVSSPSNRVYKIDKRRLLSKYQSLYFAWIIKKYNKSKNHDNKINMDYAIEEIFYYALSIKFNDKRTPKYIRIID